MTGAPFLPLMLDLRGRPVVVVGEGRLALEKTRLLAEAGAQVQIFSAQEISMPGEWNGLVHSTTGMPQAEDLEDAFLVLYAGEDQAEASRLFALCESRRKFFCSVDDPLRCSAIFPAVARSGAVQISVSTAGLSPTLARRLKDRIQAEILADDAGALAEFLGQARARVRSRLNGMEAKRAFWDRAFDSGVARVFKEEGEQKAFEFIESLLEANNGA